MDIVWSKNAKYTFYNIRNYLIHYRNPEIVEKFGRETVHVLHLLSKNPHLGKFRKDLECNEILVWKYTSLYYLVKEDMVHLIRFYDNRQKPLTIFTL